MFISEREAHRVEAFHGMINQHEKTLVFCATQEHALVVRDFINQIKKSTDPNTAFVSPQMMALAVNSSFGTFRITKNHPHDSHDLAKALNRCLMLVTSAHCIDAADKLVIESANHRARYPVV